MEARSPSGTVDHGTVACHHHEFACKKGANSVKPCQYDFTVSCQILRLKLPSNGIHPTDQGWYSRRTLVRPEFADWRRRSRLVGDQVRKQSTVLSKTYSPPPSATEPSNWWNPIPWSPEKSETKEKQFFGVRSRQFPFTA